MLTDRKGFTLIELIVVMAVFIVIIMITGDAFKTIITQMGKITKSEESNIEGVVGLEMFRHDLQQAGFGLPYSFQADITYTEAGSVPASGYNDGTGITGRQVPRAVVAGNNLAATAGSTGNEATNIIAGTDYLALKGTTLSNLQTAQKWTYVENDGAAIAAKVWGNAAADLEVDQDRVTVIRRSFAGTDYQNELVVSGSVYGPPFELAGFANTDFNPPNALETHYVYGIASETLRMPFNRVDYFVARPTTAGRMPAFCSPNTGILYKATVSHVDGGLSYIPLLDCVADMQVVLAWDLTDGMGNEGQDGVVDTYSTPIGSTGDPTTVSGTASVATVKAALLDSERLRKSLKFVKIYILAQIGKRDTGYLSPASYILGDAATDFFTSKTYDLTAIPAMRNYHWKVYRITVRPKNLQANQ
ncbi:MAG: prepilin-type N-terminal cleavage/methylation domain-containing protein [Desulfuromonadaceae bacterium]